MADLEAEKHSSISLQAEPEAHDPSAASSSASVAIGSQDAWATLLRNLQVAEDAACTRGS